MNQTLSEKCSRLALFTALIMISALPNTTSAATAVIVDTTYVVDAQKRNAIIWDTRSVALYKQGHIPGAVNIGDIGQELRDEHREDYIALSRIEKILGDAGIDPSKEIVVYGLKGNPVVYFGLVTLQYFNAANPKIYHGGIDDWKAAGQAVTSDASKLAAVSLKIKVKPELLVDTAEVVRKLKDPKVQIVDARTPEEFRGEDIRAIRGGHIPGAIPIHYMENWVDPDTPAKLEKKLVANKDGMSLKPRKDLLALYSKLDPEKETIVYCQSGIRAAETATVLADLGFKNVRVYDSSWIGYGATLDAPAEDVTFFNVGNMQAKINGMEKRIDNLEKELTTAKSPR